MFGKSFSRAFKLESGSFMNDKIREFKNFINDTGKSISSQSDYLVLLCGSVLTERNPRDIDMIIYTKEDAEIFSNKLLCNIRSLDPKAELIYITTLQMYSLKCISGSVRFSLHIVSWNKVNSFIDQASQVETYTDINIFAFDLYYQIVYRKWIMETEYLTGNEMLKAELVNNLNSKVIPYEAAVKRLTQRIKNNVNYFVQKVSKTDAVCNIILCQIINQLVNYSYLVNGVYYGAVKYIKSDMKKFTKATEVSELSLVLLEKMNLMDLEQCKIILTRVLSAIVEPEAADLSQESLDDFVEAKIEKTSAQINYSTVLNQRVDCVIDRPMGTCHPRHPEMIYPINYGYVPGVKAGDGLEQDVYVLGIDRPIKQFSGIVIGVYHRLNDCEDKWIAAPKGTNFSKEEILEKIHFQEQYFDGELYL